MLHESDFDLNKPFLRNGATGLDVEKDSLLSLDEDSLLSFSVVSWLVMLTGSALGGRGFLYRFVLLRGVGRQGSGLFLNIASFTSAIDSPSSSRIFLLISFSSPLVNFLVILLIDFCASLPIFPILLSRLLRGVASGCMPSMFPTLGIGAPKATLCTRSQNSVHLLVSPSLSPCQQACKGI